VLSREGGDVLFKRKLPELTANSRLFVPPNGRAKSSVLTYGVRKFGVVRWLGEGEEVTQTQTVPASMALATRTARPKFSVKMAVARLYSVSFACWMTSNQQISKEVEDEGRQAKAFFVLELNDDSHGSENLLLDNPHIWSSVCEYRQLDELSLRTMPLSADMHFGAAFEAGVDVSHDASSTTLRTLRDSMLLWLVYDLPLFLTCVIVIFPGYKLVCCQQYPFAHSSGKGMCELVKIGLDV
jgi:hypothetical protein